MNSNIISSIKQNMIAYLDNKQMKRLDLVLKKYLQSTKDKENSSNEENQTQAMIDNFLSAKRVEGCSQKTLKFYKNILQNVIPSFKKSLEHITTDDLRNYLNQYSIEHKISKVTTDNTRRILSSFFNWLEDENIIIKSPMKRIHKVRTGKVVKTTFTDEILEKIRDNCKTKRDLAIIDLLSSSGMRVGELIHLNRDDIDFERRECIVFGKGSKERKVYFDARTKIHLEKYLESRKDDNPALFLTQNGTQKRLEIPGVEIMLRQLSNIVGTKVHPHKFRRTLATMAISKGMPIEQVQHLLGHRSLDTTMQYAMVNEDNVKISHQKFIS